MKKVKIFKSVGGFAENKDIAQTLRKDIIVPALEKGEEIVLDFDEVEAVTQSFIHALISDLMRNYDNTLDLVSFKNCNNTVKKIIEIVTDYMQES